ncbi:SDR family oxidoreductase, partial [Pelagibacteraceae bacterium]|nr:SDR family oxidoreductase [Pelagibacteraceae bacterium]
MTEKARLIILGSESFIAKSVINKLKKKFKIIKISRKNINLNSVKETKKLKKIVKNGDRIFFAAAKAPVKNFNMFNYNINICNNIIENIIDKKIKHFTYLSSDAVYKDSKNLLNENSLLEPSSLHGLMHLLREKYIKAHLNTKICIIRPTLVFGKEDPHNGYGPNKFIRTAHKKKFIDLFGKGEELRDHIYINDLATLISKLIIKQYDGPLNLVTGKVISFLNIAKIIKRNI